MSFEVISRSAAQRNVDAESFVDYWETLAADPDSGGSGRISEDQETQNFWLDLMSRVLGVKNATQECRFEQRTSGKGLIDVRIPEASVLIEQKAGGVNLDLPELRQGVKVTPFQQAKRYVDALPNRERPDWIIVCNFFTFRIHDLNKEFPEKDFIEFELEDLAKKPHLLDFLLNASLAREFLEQEVSIKAGELIGELHSALSKRYFNPDSPEEAHALNVLCVRLVFCLYAEDAGLFGKDAFLSYLSGFTAEQMRAALLELFQVLDTPLESRDPYLSGVLKAFPYVNGGLFAGELQIPQFTEELKTLLLERTARDTDWSRISPTIFGGIFESTLNPETRRSGGMHYTDPVNIHKVIDPLFLDDLRAELEELLNDTSLTPRKKTNRLMDFQDKLASLKCLDPAAGSGNFLTETYISLRRLENRVLAELAGGQTSFEFEGIGESAVKVSLDQFYGIEINDFAVSVAQTALWIASLQANQETETILHREVKDLPLENLPNIRLANALQLDWNEVLRAESCTYCYGNPPFIGYSRLSAEQKADRKDIFGKAGGVLDYVACWYRKAADYMEGNPSIQAAFVSTNSICQGQQVKPLWEPLMSRGIVINFAHRTFIWENESNYQAHVYCVIVGFSYTPRERKFVWDYGRSAASSPAPAGTTGESPLVVSREVNHLNGYLAEAADVFLDRQKQPLSSVPGMAQGFKPADGGNLLLSPKEREELLAVEPGAAKWIRKFSMGAEFIKGEDRYCLWLPDITPSELQALPHVRARVEACRTWRLAQVKTGDAYKLADTPHLLRPAGKFVDGTYIGVPSVSSERRQYIPIGFVRDGMIPGNMLYFIPSDSLYVFGVMMSQVHNAWMRVVAGRLKSDYRYGNTTVYNNFVWPEPTDAQRQRIETAAQAVLDARGGYQSGEQPATLADLYDPDNSWLYPELTRAHLALDRAVEKAYGLDFPADMDDSAREEAIVACLFELYRLATKVCVN